MTNHTTPPKLDPQTLLNSNPDALNKAFTGNFVRVKVSLSRFDDAVKDINLSAELLNNHGVTDKSAGKFIKNLMTGARRELDEMNSAMSAVRTKSYTVSRKLDRDFYVVAIPDLPDAIAELTEAKDLALEKVEAFLTAYPQRIAEAQQVLGTLASAYEYPSVEDLRAKIKVGVKFEPLPDMRSFSHMNLPAEVAATFASQVGNSQRDLVTSAMTELYDDLVETTTHLATQYKRKVNGEKNVKIYDSRVTQIKRLARQLKAAEGIVTTDFSDLSAALDTLASVDFDEAKESIGAASAISEQAQELANKLTGLGKRTNAAAVEKVEDIVETPIIEPDLSNEMVEAHLPVERGEAIIPPTNPTPVEEPVPDAADPFASLESLFY